MARRYRGIPQAILGRDDVDAESQGGRIHRREQAYALGAANVRWRTQMKLDLFALLLVAVPFAGIYWGLR